jgi:two-component system, NtrC family, sensor histidine kinase HydH
LRTFAHIATILAAFAGILTLSVAGARREQRRLLDDFTIGGRQQVKASAGALSSRLDAFEQDTHLLIDLVEKSMSGREVELATERRVWASAFRALATVVPNYRTIGLFRRDGSLEVKGVDPTENDSTADALLDQSRSLAQTVAETGRKTLAKDAVHYGRRWFFLYGVPVRGGAIVVASDVALFLVTVVSTYPSLSRFFVADPSGMVWSGCETPAGCRMTPPAAVPMAVRSPLAGISEIDAATAAGMELGRAPAVRLTERVERPTGAWILTLVASSHSIVERERLLLLRLVLTALGVAVAVAGVGLVFLRQQRRAAALEASLRYAQGLASARETSESLVENAPLGVLGISQDGRVVLANRFLVDRLGPIQVGAALTEAFSGDGAAWIHDIAPLLSEGAPPGTSGSQYRDLRSASTAAPQLEVRIVPARNPALGVRTFVLVEDRSQIRSLENQLVRAEKLITVGVLSAGIAHEIGSPLAVIRGRAEQVRRRDPEAASAEDLGIMIRHIDQISSTIRQLLDFSRGQPIERRAVAIDSAVKRAAELLQWKLDAKSLRLTVDLDRHLPPVAADPDQIQQVLVNLLLNACDASEMGTTIQVAARATGEPETTDEPKTTGKPGATGEPRETDQHLVSIQVIDKGSGILPEHMNAVFDPFFTTKTRGHGTGLGLSIVSSIVRNHGGEIVLTSAPGKGTTVTITWPSAAHIRNDNA